MFLILFENIVKHCGITQEPGVAVRLTEQAESIVIHVENDLAVWVRTDATEASVARIKDAMMRGESKEYASREGSSGLHKIRRLLENYGLLHEIRFAFASNTSFYVDITIRKESL
jgi:site-specific recombinase